MSVLWLVLALLPVLGGAERFSCRGRILGAYYADAKSGCKAFHVCVRVAGGGIRDFRFFCPPGTLFHQEAQTCTDWGDDDPLACPADLYDGSFDLYKIGSGFDTKKVSVNNNNINNREDEAEFGLQRAETGDKRLSPSGPASDLKASHSSDFFSGQRERGRDDAHPGHSPASSTSLRQSYRSRPTTRAPTSLSTQYSTVPEPPSSQRPQYDTKRKLVRKRPIYYSSTPSSNSFGSSSLSSRQYYPDQNEQKFRTSENKALTSPPANVPPQYKDEYVEVPRVTPKSRVNTASVTPTAFAQSAPAQRQGKKEGLTEVYNYDSQSTPVFNNAPSDRPFKVRNNYNVANDVPRNSEYFRKNVNVSPNGLKGTQNTPDYTPSAATSTPSHRNFNSVSFESEKNNFVNYPTGKQNYFNSPSTTPATTAFTTARHETPSKLNTVAYNTNIGFDAHPINYSESEEDDGQYRLPDGEDDGQYRPELYGRERSRERERDRELLSGAHSLNIAASGNRLPDDQKPRTKATSSQTSEPRPFRPAPTPSSPPSPSTRAPEPTYATTFRPQTFNTQRTFDYFQTYTTTLRPEVPQNSQNFNKVPVREPSPTVAAPHPEPRPQPSRAPAPPQQTRAPAPAQPRAPPPPTAAPAPRPTTRQPPFAKPASNKDDNSYDYAYYDSDPGFSEYDQIEEFGKTKSRV